MSSLLFHFWMHLFGTVFDEISNEKKKFSKIIRYSNLTSHSHTKTLMCKSQNNYKFLAFLQLEKVVNIVCGCFWFCVCIWLIVLLKCLCIGWLILFVWLCMCLRVFWLCACLLADLFCLFVCVVVALLASGFARWNLLKHYIRSNHAWTQFFSTYYNWSFFYPSWISLD